MKHVSPRARATMLACAIILFISSQAGAQIRQTKLYIDDGGGHFLQLIVGSLSGTGATVTFGQPTVNTNAVLTPSSGSGATGDVLYWDATTGTFQRLVMGGTGTVLHGQGANQPPVYGTVSLSSDVSGTLDLAGAHVSGHLGVANGGTGTTSLASLASSLQPFATDILPSNAAGSLTNDGTGLLSWSPALTNPLTSEGQMIYNHSSALSALNLGSNNFILASNGIDPAWTDPATITVGTATSANEVNGLTFPAVAIGTSGEMLSNNGTTLSWVPALANPMTTEGDMIYQHSGSATNLPLGTATYLLASNGADPAWTDPSTISVGKINGVAFPAIAIGTSGEFLTNNGTTLSWAPSISASGNNTFTGSSVFAPTASGATAAKVEGTSGGGSADIFDVTGSGGAPNYLSVNSAGAVTIPTLSVPDNGFTIYNHTTPANTATFTAASLTTPQTYTLPNASGTLALTSASNTWTNSSTFAPTGSGVTAATVEGTSGGGSADIFDVTNAGGGTKYLSIGSTGAITAPAINTNDGASGFTIQNASDNSKKVQFDASGITTATTRTYTLPNASGTIALTGASNNNTTSNFSSLGINIGATTPNTNLDVNGDVAVRNSNSLLTGALLTDVSTASISNLTFNSEAANFSVAGFANGFDGKVLHVYNNTGHSMTIKNQDATDESGHAANEINTLSGGDVTLSGNGSVNFNYDAASSMWIMQPAMANTIVGLAAVGINYLVEGSSQSGTASNITDGTLNFTGIANAVYEVKGLLLVNSTGSSQSFSIGFINSSTGTITPSIAVFDGNQGTGANSLKAASIVTVGGTAGMQNLSQANSSLNFITVSGIIIMPSSNVGTISMIWNATTSDALQANSYLSITRVK